MLTISVSVPSNNEKDSNLCERSTHTKTFTGIHLSMTYLSVYDCDTLFWTPNMPAEKQAELPLAAFTAM